MKTYLLIQEGLGNCKKEKKIEIEKETNKYWYCFPYKYSKKKMQAIGSKDVIVKKVIYSN